jgi:transposase
VKKCARSSFSQHEIVIQFPLILKEKRMSDKPRVQRPNRSQLLFDTVDLESQVSEDHLARTVWSFVETLDVTPLEEEIKAREGSPGRPTPDRRLYVALWLYATLDGVGAARELDRLCREHTAYRWLCGGVPVNYHDLGDFRVAAGSFLDDLLSKSIAGLIDQGFVSTDCLAVDSVRVRANAGASSFRRKETLLELYDAAQATIAELRAEIDADPGAASKRLQARRLRAASDRAAGIKAAKEATDKIEAERAKEAKEQRRKKPKDKETRASTTDPEARIMKCDGGFRPAYNAQIRTDAKSCMIIGVEVTDRASDRGQLRPAIEDVERRYGRRPKQALADGGYASKDDIEHLHGHQAGPVDVFCPLPQTKGRSAAPKPGEGPGVTAWRERMSNDEGQKVYKGRFATERPHADMRNRGLRCLLVRGKEKVKAVVLWHITAYNLLQQRFLVRMAGRAQPSAA